MSVKTNEKLLMLLSKKFDTMAETERGHSKAAYPLAGRGPVRTNNAAMTPLGPVPVWDAAEMRGRGVRETHPTLVSQAIRRLALLAFLPAPLYQTFWKVA